MATICLDFILFPNKTPMPTPFTLASFEFRSVGAGKPPDIAAFHSGRKALRFENEGIEIKLPTPTSEISMIIGQFAPGDINVKLVDASGDLVDVATINSYNSYTAKKFALKQKAAIVTITGGSNEGVLAEICVEV